MMHDVIQASVLLRPDAPELRYLPEGPYPIGESHGFSWVAIQHGSQSRSGSLNLYEPVTQQATQYELPGRPGFAFPTSQPGVFIVGCERSLGLYSTIDRSWHEVVSGIDSDCENTIINDGVTWDGNLIFGCKDLEFKSKKAGLYLYRGCDGQLIRLRNDQICSNGKAIAKNSEGAITLYDIDSPTRLVVAYDVNVEQGTLSPPKTVIDLTDDPAVPDGMIATPDGKSVIVAMFNPNPAPFGETRQYRLSDGALEKIWRLEASPQNTCPQLVRWNGRVWLVITTAVEHMSAAQQLEATNAGCLFFAPTEWTTLGDTPVFRLSSQLRSRVAV